MILFLIEGFLIVLVSLTIYQGVMPEDRYILRWSFPVGVLDQSQLTSHNVAFLFLPEYREKIDLVRATYRNGTLIDFQTWTQSTLFWVYELTLP